MASTTDTGDPPLYRYRFGGAEYDESRQSLRVGDTPVEMEQRPLQVLAVLLRRADEAVTREELFDAVWAGRPTVDNVLPNAVAKLRKALGPRDGARIHTLPRFGYRLEGPVERTVAGRGAFLPPTLAAGQPVPGRRHFHLREPLDAAAGGLVWLARHDKTGAARVYKFAAGGERLAALKREVTICRALRESLGERDDFVRVLDWNFDTPPFYIECDDAGTDLLRWAQDDGRLAGMAPAQRLDLFLQVADAVAAAHGAGVLHKDLKPANLLVAPRGDGWRVRVADFGSGHLRDPQRLVALGITRLGFTVTQPLPAEAGVTPLYVAPELLAGIEPTAKSDVYALGLVLFQLVVGDLRRPLAPGWERDVGDELLREDIAAATDGDPAMRPEAAALAERLRAQDMRRRERTRLRAAEARARDAERLLERGRARRPWIAAALALLLAGLGASLWQFRRARDARDEARQQAAIAEATNRFLNQDLLGAGIGDDSPAWYERNPSLREILDAAAQRLDTRFAGEPLLLADLHQTLGRAYRSTGAYAKAAAQLQAAADLFVRSLGRDDERSLLAQYELAGVLSNLSRFKEAHVLLDRADAANHGRDTVTELALHAHLARGDVLYQQMRVTPALAEYRSAENLQKLLRPNDTALSAHLLLAIAGCDLRLGQPRTAEAIARTILAGAPYTQARVGLGTLATARSRLGDALRGQGRYAEAIPVTQQSLADYERANGSDSQGDQRTEHARLSLLAHR